MNKEMIISSSDHDTRVAILEDDQVVEIFIEREHQRGVVGNIYKGRVSKVLPGMQSSFVDIGLERDAFSTSPKSSTPSRSSSGSSRRRRGRAAPTAAVAEPPAAEAAADGERRRPPAPAERRRRADRARRAIATATDDRRSRRSKTC